MKKSLLIKIFLVLPLILFVDYIIMALLGCSTCLFGVGNEFYCGPFCIAGKLILVISLALFICIIWPDIRKPEKSNNNAPTQKNKENL